MTKQKKREESKITILITTAEEETDIFLVSYKTSFLLLFITHEIYYKITRRGFAYLLIQKLCNESYKLAFYNNVFYLS